MPDIQAEKVLAPNGRKYRLHRTDKGTVFVYVSATRTSGKSGAVRVYGSVEPVRTWDSDTSTYVNKFKPLGKWAHLLKPPIVASNDQHSAPALSGATVG
jgi:hypothetical protein